VLPWPYKQITLNKSLASLVNCVCPRRAQSFSVHRNLVGHVSPGLFMQGWVLLRTYFILKPILKKGNFKIYLSTHRQHKTDNFYEQRSSRITNYTVAKLSRDVLKYIVSCWPFVVGSRYLCNRAATDARKSEKSVPILTKVYLAVAVLHALKDP